MEGKDMEEQAVSADDEELRAVDGRVPGRRGRATRQKLLECTSAMLRTTSYRDLKVVDIAREAGTSPATFYQYFADVEAAVHVLAEEMAQQGHRFAEMVQENRWKGRSGYDGAVRLADEFISFWDEHRSVLRVVDLATNEGDNRFANIRTRLLNDFNNALSEAIAEMKRSGRHPEEVDPLATAGVLVAMLAHVSAHRYGFEFWGVRTADLRTSMARIIYTAVSGQKAPS
jgi:AcrR family transcriptional regulator